MDSDKPESNRPDADEKADSASPAEAKEKSDANSENGGAREKAEGGPRDGRFRKRRDVPSGLWTRCAACSKMIYKSLVLERGNVCPECNYHFEITSEERIRLICDPDTFEERFTDLEPGDPLEFVAKRAYKERLEQVQKKTGLKDGCVVGTAAIAKHPIVFGVSDSRFLRGSMGSVVGEKICRGMELARELGQPFIFIS
ncbi:MAG: acetyl-CoA carboxylase carboxyl transferase subunit beta, partial [Planctomycetota bacterium]